MSLTEINLWIEWAKDEVEEYLEFIKDLKAELKRRHSPKQK